MTASVEPGAVFAGHPVQSSGLYGPGTHPRSPLADHMCARMVAIGHGGAPIWTTFNPRDLPAAGARALPVALRDLWDLAYGNGWLVRIAWEATYQADHPAGVGHPYATLETARAALPGQQAPGGWWFQYTWHTYATGTYRLFGRLARDPARRAPYDGPSVRQARNTIAALPVPS